MKQSNMLREKGAEYHRSSGLCLQPKPNLVAKIAFEARAIPIAVAALISCIRVFTEPVR